MKKVFEFDGGELEYEVLGSGKQTIVLLPPGMGNLNSLSPLANKLAEKYQVISINFPGVGKSSIKEPNFATIGTSIDLLIKSMEITEPILIGFSYGGSVVLEIAMNIPAKAIGIVVSGEFFSPWQKILLKIIFYPSKYSKNIRKLLSIIITKTGMINFCEYSDYKLKEIGMRWNETLEYKLPNWKFEGKSLVVLANKDEIVSKTSTKKLLEIFPRAETFRYDLGHFEVLKMVSQKDFSPVTTWLEETE